LWKAPAKCAWARKGRRARGQAIYIPHRVFHQLTNTGATPMRMIYATDRPATWPTGARNWMARCARGVEAPRCPPGRGRNRREAMTTHTVGIVINGVTGRMGLNQHCGGPSKPSFSKAGQAER